MKTWRLLAASLLPCVLACGRATGRTQTFSFLPDGPSTSEAYLCFGFDPGGATRGYVTSFDWTPPATGGVQLHHATLFSLDVDYPDGPVPCEGMIEGALTLHVWAPGSDAPLPAGVGMELPADTRRLVVQAHALRF